MAGREKKPAVIKKQNISAVLSKDSANQLDIAAEKTTPTKAGGAKLETAAPQQSSTSSPAAKTVKTKKANPTNKTIKKNNKIKFNSKNKTAKKLKLSKSLFKNKKNIDIKNVTIVKNGIKKRGKQTKKSQVSVSTTDKKDENNKDLPPVLEPMITLPEISETKSPKKETKKRTKKQAVEDISEPNLPAIDTKKIKIEPVDHETVDDVINAVANELHLDLDSLLKKPAKNVKVTKKQVKPAVKQKKPSTPKKIKTDPKVKKSPQKSIIIETLSKDFNMDSDAQNVINKLDLNVNKIMRKDVKKRRHSIEKFHSVGDNRDSLFEQPFSIFSPLYRSASPKSKRNARKSVETSKRFSPYSTRSDSPARILRNGKHRKLKGPQLLDGIENEYKRRKRLCSDVSTNDISKFSDYLSESDSNFSDMTSMTENGNFDDSSVKDESVMTKSDLLRKEILESITVPGPDELQNLNIKQISTKFTAILKRSLSTETSQLTSDNINEDVKPKEELSDNTFTDTNSNDLKPNVKLEITDSIPTMPTINKDDKTDVMLDLVKVEKCEDDKETTSSPSCKVPEKLFILDQMKLTFNDNNENTEGQQKRTTRASTKKTLKVSEDEYSMETMTVGKFYGTDKNDTNTLNETKTDEKIETTEIEEIIATETTETDEKTKINEKTKLSGTDEEAKMTETNEKSKTNEIDEKIKPAEINEKTETIETVEKIDIIKTDEKTETKEIDVETKTDLNLNNEEKEDFPKSESRKEDEEMKSAEIISNTSQETQTEDISIDLNKPDSEIISTLSENVEIKNSENITTLLENIEIKDSKTIKDSEQSIEEGNQNKKFDNIDNNIVGLEEKMKLGNVETDELSITEASGDSLNEDNKCKVDAHESILTKLRENSSLSISVKGMNADFKSKSGSESGESINGTVMEKMVNEAIKKLDEYRSEEMNVDSNLEEDKDTVNEDLYNNEDMEINTENINDTTRSSEEENNKSLKRTELVETPENLVIKENILSALGLRSLKAAEEEKLREKQKPVNKNDVYTGTLKTVIKLNRSVDKKKSKERNPLKMTLQKSKSRSSKDGDCDNTKSDGASGRYEGENACYKVMKETSSSATSRHSSDTVGANRKSHYSNRSNLEGDQNSDNDAAEGESGAKELVIPEKASSFSIHPGRLCSDECAYCFGKFGLFDTPLHIAQIKSVERQNKILENEVYLTKDSCLCDACYRHIDRRITAGCLGKSLKRNTNSSAPNVPRANYCHVIGCDHESSNVLRRKWLLKMRKSIVKLVNIDLDNPTLHSIPVCSDHYTAVEHLMVCALCKRRLTRNHIHYLASECETLNAALQKEGIPVTLADKPLVCKLCRYFSSLMLKPPPADSQSNTAEFFRQYKKRLLQCYDVEVTEDEDTSESASKEKEMLKKKNKSSKLSKSKLMTSNSSSSTASSSATADTDKPDQMNVPFNSENGESRASTPSDTVIDYETLVPNLSLEYSDVEDSKNQVPQKQIFRKQIPESVREAVEISKIMKVKKGNLIERLGTNSSISVRQLFQGEEDLPLYANIDFNAAKERTPEGWEKNICTIQYDNDTKQLWQELQKPYGNQSSFLRHLILLEKYFRNGDLTLSPHASHHAVNYSVSVQNRLRAYDNIPSSSVPMQPLTMLPFNQVKKSQSGIITTRETPNLSAVINAANLPKNTPIHISQLNPNLLTQLSVRHKTQSVPPGLISIQSNTGNKPKPVQKLKVPVGKNWKPTLIPVTAASTAADRRISGLVQVISGGKPYHISLQDYNKMCYLKKTQELKKLNESKKVEIINTTPQTSMLKGIVPRKQKVVPITPKLAKEAPATITSNDVAKDPHGSKSDSKSSPSKAVMILPKIPKSLTVIPQTVSRKPLRPPSPTLSIITKPSTSRS